MNWTIPEQSTTVHPARWRCARLLFLVLAAVMVVIRKVDCYQLANARPMAPWPQV
ncbi:hypothetical protein [Cognatilysobacter bugurensis]|uniref:hypothetical protein n=1 Tax=Cognatilysobacter bugurensis TaxID=543356 RepID=UPI00167ADEF5|nr:hypothetical protein [Lysobacter bugurensis]